MFTPSPSPAHKRTPSSSFRIAINHQPSSESLRQRTKRMRALYSSSGANDSFVAIVGTWLNGRSWGRVRRWVWILVVVVVGVWVGFGVSSGRLPAGRRRKLDGVFLDQNTVAPPKVDRNAYEKLRLLEMHWGGGDGTTGDSQPSDTTTDDENRHSHDSPPLVAIIPDVQKPNPLLPASLPKLPASILDAQVCPSRASAGQQCAFLIPAFLGEQETKAQQHLYQLGLLASSLNRTLVLPNVHKSRLGTCFANPFAFYYAQESLDSLLGVETISYAEFLEWSQRRDPPPSAQVVSMATPKTTYPEGAIEIDSGIADTGSIPNKPSRNICLKPPRTRLNFLNHSPVVLYPPEGYHKSESKRVAFGNSVVNTLSSEKVAQKASRKMKGRLYDDDTGTPNVLAFNYELRYPLLTPAQVVQFNPDLPLPSPYDHFSYAPQWTTIASSLADSLSPFLSIHWRTETLPSNNLVPCASSLISKILSLSDEYPEIRTIYLATDYPIEDLEEGIAFEQSTPHSGTFAKAVTKKHHLAFKNLLREFEKKPFLDRGLRWTTFIKEEREGRITYDESIKEALTKAKVDSIAALDPGLVGIIDKVMTIRSEVFLTGLSGTNDGCAKVSSFTTMIVDKRGEALEVQGQDEGQREKGKLWNKVARWNVKGDYAD